MPPTVGRVVHYFAEGYPSNPSQPWAALVVKVHEGGTRVNLAAYDSVGNHVPMANVPFDLDGKVDRSRPWCAWQEKIVEVAWPEKIVEVASNPVVIGADGEVAATDGKSEHSSEVPQS